MMVAPGVAKVLVVGAGGIGCELLKNLVLSGYGDITVIDLDTIDFSNLNRQFLFRKEHVGKPKALVAKESVQAFCRDAKVTAIHDTIIKPDYNREFFGGFDIVLNALDNRLARNHVNRLCLAANVPLVESGSQGYLGQVEPILKGLYECYECRPKAVPPTFAGCTIRNTPSEPIHCIVWAKHLFNQLFGLPDADEDVSPDTEDPELSSKNRSEDKNGSFNNHQESGDGDGSSSRVSTREWATQRGYEPAALFDKLFHKDILYLKSMANLWKKRRSPDAITFPSSGELSGWKPPVGHRDQRVWDDLECAVNFRDSVITLKNRLSGASDSDEYLTWDKDDEAALDFVTACANVRMRCFGMSPLSQFRVKSMAGNIIPAIATTNAVIAGSVVIQATRILRGDERGCRGMVLHQDENPSTHQVLRPIILDKPNPKCYACSEKNEVFVVTNTKSSTMKAFRDKCLKAILNMAAPDVALEGSSSIIISSEEGDTDHLEERSLESLGVGHCARLLCDDYLQNFNVVVNIVHSDDLLKDGAEFQLLGECPMASSTSNVDLQNGKNSNGGNDTLQVSEVKSASTSQENTAAVTYDVNLDKEDDEDLVVVEPEDEDEPPIKRHRQE